MRFQGVCYRAHDPRWSHAPLSGDGAAVRGGRFNRKGQPALYTSLEIETAIAECLQGLAHRMPPLTMVQYDADCEPIADLSDETGRSAHGVSLAELGCAWMSELRAGREPSSWTITDRLRAEGHAGVIVPSFAPDALPFQRNLVLWAWGDDLPTKISVYDPEQRLPRGPF